jgi:hypothetical protein
MIKRLTILVALIMFSFTIQSQQTVGVDINEEGATEGYTFFSPIRSSSAFLVDNCGFLVNQWDRDWRPGLSGYLLENGLMLRCNNSPGNFPQYSSGGIVELVDWDNNVMWSYDFAEAGVYNQHHDLAYMPNGNIIVLGWEVIEVEEQEELGKENVTGSDLWGEFVWEVRPVGTDDIEIVWEWHLKDHFIQDHDDTKETFGVIADNIGLVDIDYSGPGWWSSRDWWHANAIDYNPGKDQILINARNNNELWIIDHSTTTEEAASNEGGNSGKGGNLLFRWGNPMAYDNGTPDDLRMYGSHGHYWIPEGLPNAGNIMYFNNGENRPEGYYSTIEMLTPLENADGSYALDSDNFYGPREPTVVYQAPQPFDFVSRFLSNGQQLPNGNVLINEGEFGRLFEVNSDMEIVWQYKSPVGWFGTVQQGQDPGGNSIFRAYKFTADYGAFEGQDLVSGDLLEGPSEFEICNSISTEEINQELDIDLRYNMANQQLRIKNIANDDLEISVYSILGQLTESKRSSVQSIDLDFTNYQSGTYLVILQNQEGKNLLKKFIIPE